jgi:hypothetical protein
MEWRDQRENRQGQGREAGFQPNGPAREALIARIDRDTPVSVVAQDYALGGYFSSDLDGCQHLLSFQDVKTGSCIEFNRLGADNSGTG